MHVRAREGAWIETFCVGVMPSPVPFAPARARGLKREHADGGVVALIVRAREGAWIETMNPREAQSISACSRPRGRVD